MTKVDLLIKGNLLIYSNISGGGFPNLLCR
jgi:hypothetical protein